MSPGSHTRLPNVGQREQSAKEDLKRETDLLRRDMREMERGMRSLPGFFFRAIFAFRFLNIQRINFCKCCRENVMLGHRYFSCLLTADASRNY